MSHSPGTADAPPDQIDRYQQSWHALSELIADGHSFSGRERNCCFLNLGNGNFADISAAAALDYPDDSRAVATVDWNFDGRLDLWVTNRTEPRIRLLRNATQNDGQFIAIRLTGATCNRDAIGARVELYLKDMPERPVVRHVSAGDGFLSQSTKWLHFGIPRQHQVDRLTVVWPGGDSATFRGVEANNYYTIVQDAPIVERWTPPVPTEVIPNVARKSPPNDRLQRTILVDKVAMPDAKYQDWDGESIRLSTHFGRPVLLNLWSPTCVPCLDELANWSREATRIDETDLDIIALSIDALIESTETPSAATTGQQTLERLGFHGSAGIASAELVDTLQLMHHSFVSDRSQLPLPTSFLLDRQGRLAAIYKGILPVSVLLADVEGLDHNPEIRRSSAVPFPGRWATVPRRADVVRIIQKLDDQNRLTTAIDFTRRCLDDLKDLETSDSSETDALATELLIRLGDLLLKAGQRQEAGATFARALGSDPDAAATRRRVGETYLAHRQPSKAVEHLEVALLETPDDPRLLYHLGLANLARNRPDEAVTYLTRAYELTPTDVDTCFHLANALHATQQTPKAIEFYRQALVIRPGWPFAANNLAWILATHSDASIRNGDEAVALAEALCGGQADPDHAWLATLAASYAEVGRFDEAVAVNERAADLAEVHGNQRASTRLRARSAIFASHQPLRD